MLEDIKLYLIADLSEKTKNTFFQRVEFYLESGVRLFQLRAKGESEDSLRIYIERLKLLSEKYNAVFIINDYWYFVNEFELDGVHVGREDFPVLVFKSLIAPEKIAGYTVNNEEDLAFANKIKPDYIGIGPAFFTETKSKDRLAPILGPEGVKKIVLKTFIPYYAIGGISDENIFLLLEKGINRFAISSYLMLNPSPQKAVKLLKKYNLL